MDTSEKTQGCWEDPGAKYVGRQSSNYIRNLSSDGHEFIVKLDLALTSRTVKVQFQVAHSKQIKPLLGVIISSSPPKCFHEKWKTISEFSQMF